MSISVSMVLTMAVSLMGSTMPLVPSMDIPPSIPRRGLNVDPAILLPSGTDITTENPPVYPHAEATSSSASRIIDLGTLFMAASPGGWSSPRRVTLPTPSPPSMDIPEGARDTVERTSAPWVASMSSPPSFLTAQDADPPFMTASSTGRSRTIPLGVAIDTDPAFLPVRSIPAAALDAAAAQVPVV